VKRRDLLRALGAGAAATALPRWQGAAEAAATAGAARPNVLFILADDLGWRDTSLYGSTFHETPNVERLARRGMMFTNAYAANPLCSPTRASIQTGLWPARIGITAPACHLPEEKFEETVAERGSPDVKVISCASATRLKHEYYTLAEALRDAGYRTGHFGKWHLGQEPYDPLRQGYDVDVPHWGGPGPAGSYLAPWKFPAKLDFAGAPGEHIEDRMAGEAARFIRQNRDRPFFMTYWCFSVHAPFDAKKVYVEKYRARADPANPQRNPLYAAMVRSMDDAVGRILDALDEPAWPGTRSSSSSPITAVSIGPATGARGMKTNSRAYPLRATPPCEAERPPSTRAARACRASSSVPVRRRPARRATPSSRASTSMVLDPGPEGGLPGGVHPRLQGRGGQPGG